MSLEEKYTIPPKTQLIELNSDGSRAFLIDNSNVLRLLQLEKKSNIITVESSLAKQSEKALQSVLHSFINFIDHSRAIFPARIQRCLVGKMVL